MSKFCEICHADVDITQFLRVVDGVAESLRHSRRDRQAVLKEHLYAAIGRYFDLVPGIDALFYYRYF